MEVGILQEGSARSVANNLWTEATDSTRCRRTTCTLGFQHKQCSSIFLDYFGCVFLEDLACAITIFFVFLNWRCLSLALDPWMLLYRMFVYLIIDIQSLCQWSTTSRRRISLVHVKISYNSSTLFYQKTHNQTNKRGITNNNYTKEPCTKSTQQ
jgi:hypothetical protein